MPVLQQLPGQDLAVVQHAGHQDAALDRGDEVVGEFLGRHVDLRLMALRGVLDVLEEELAPGHHPLEIELAHVVVEQV